MKITFSIIIMGLIIVISIRGYSYLHRIKTAGDHYQQAALNLEVGMNRIEAEIILKDAKSHYQCRYQDFSVDYYLFDDNLNITSALYIKYEQVNEIDIIVEMRHIESYLVANAIKQCNAVGVQLDNHYIFSSAT